MMRKSLFVAIAICFAVCQIAGAATINVPADHLTIQAAVDAAVNLDTVLVQDGTYDPFKIDGKDIVVISANGPAACTVNVTTTNGINADGSNYCGVVLFNCPVTTRVSGFTVQGPATYADEYSRGVTIGGQAGPASSGELDNCVITGFDNSGNWGGGVSLGNGTGQHVHDNLILANDAQHGGGMMLFNQGGNAVIEANEIRENTARGLGGPSILLYGWYTGNNALIQNNLFSGNGSENTDQGIRIREGAAWYGGTITHNSFFGEISIQDLTWGNGGFASCVGLDAVYGAYPPEYIVITNNLMFGNGNTPVNSEGGVSPRPAKDTYFGGNVTENLAGCFALAPAGVTMGTNLDITVDPFTAAPNDMTQVGGAPSIDYAGVGIANAWVAAVHGTGSWVYHPTTVDKDDTARDATPDAGAYEAGASGPTADAQCAAYAYEGNDLDLDGTGSTGASTYAWTQTGGAVGGAIADPTAALTSVPTPEWDGSTELTVAEASLEFTLAVDGGDTDTCDCYVRIPGDANGDDTINAFDIARVRTLHAEADFNDDGSVNAFDLAILRQNAGRSR